MAIGLRPNINKKLENSIFFSIKFLLTFKNIIFSQGVNKHSVKIVFVAKMT